MLLRLVNITAIVRGDYVFVLSSIIQSSRALCSFTFEIKEYFNSYNALTFIIYTIIIYYIGVKGIPYNIYIDVFVYFVQIVYL